MNMLCAPETVLVEGKESKLQILEFISLLSSCERVTRVPLFNGKFCEHVSLWYGFYSPLLLQQTSKDEYIMRKDS